MREEVDGIDPLGFTISRQEFFIDACSGFPWWPFDGAVDVFVLEAFIDKASVADDTCRGIPAVDVVMVRVCGV